MNSLGYTEQRERVLWSTNAYMRFLEKAGEGNRTLVCSLEGCRSTIELHPRSVFQTWSAKNVKLQEIFSDT